MKYIQYIDKIAEYINLKEVPPSFYNCYKNSVKFKVNNNILNIKNLKKSLNLYKLVDRKKFCEEICKYYYNI